MSWINNGAIWIKKTKKGDTFFSFKAERDIKKGENLAFFKNEKNGVENRPDYKSSTKEEEGSSVGRSYGSPKDDIDF